MDFSTINSILGAILGAIFGSIVSGVITYFVSRHYYVQSSNELKEESAKLRKNTILILIGLEKAGYLELERDSTGEILGIKTITIQVSSATQTQHIDNVTLTYHPPNQS